MDECCVVCAEPLKFCAFGQCHHQTVCSSCACRLRLLKNDTLCPICRTDCPLVFVTRFMDNHTKKVAEDTWEELKAMAVGGSGTRSLWFHTQMNAIFDDEEHFRLIQTKAGLTHPELAAVTDVSRLHIKGVDDLRRIIKLKLKVQFCELCLLHRPVFTSEQLLYTEKTLKQHCTKGDSSGVLFDNNFKGHPRCEFCKEHFYDDAALFHHMERDHFHCFLCRRRGGEANRYYKSYDELEEHFEEEHHICNETSCRESKFVVFGTDAELKTHYAKEHGDKLGARRSERRAALTVETGFTLPVQASRSSRIMRANGEPAYQDVARPVTQQRRVMGLTDQRVHAAEIQARQAAQAHRRGQVDLASEHFPGLVPSGPAAVVHSGLRSRAWGTTASVRVQPQESGEFPPMPAGGPGAGGGVVVGGVGPMKASGKKKKKSERASSRESAASTGFGDPSGLPPEYIMRMDQGGGPAAAGGAAAGMRQRSGSVPSGLGGGGDAVGLGMEPGRAGGAPLEADRTGDREGGDTNGGRGRAALEPVEAWPPAQPGMAGRRPAAPAAVHDTSFSSLSEATTDGTELFDLGAGPPEFGEPTPLRIPAPGIRRGPDPYRRPAGSFARAAVGTPAQPRGMSGAAPVAARPAASVPPAADFPALGTGLTGGSAAAAVGTGPGGCPGEPPPGAAAGAPPGMDAAGWRAARGQARQKPQPAPAPRPAQLSSMQDFPSLGGGLGGGGLTQTQEAEPAASRGGSSRALKAQNDALMATIKAKLSPSDFQVFEYRSRLYMNGSVSAADYHGDLARLGLLAQVGELMALCPNEDRSRELLEFHCAFIDRGEMPEAGSAAWCPPAALRAGAEAEPSWACAFCTLRNAPLALVCEGCKTPKVVSDVSDAQASTASAKGKGGGRKKGGKKILLGDLPQKSSGSAWGRPP